MKTHKDETVKAEEDVLHFSPAVAGEVYDREIDALESDGVFDPAVVAVLRQSFAGMGLLDHVPRDDQLFTTRFVPVSR